MAKRMQSPHVKFPNVTTPVEFVTADEERSQGGSSTASGREQKHMRFIREQAADRLFVPLKRHYLFLSIATFLLLLSITASAI